MRKHEIATARFAVFAMTPFGLMYEPTLWKSQTGLLQVEGVAVSCSNLFEFQTTVVLAEFKERKTAR